jgi:hypothetical protein
MKKLSLLLLVGVMLFITGCPLQTRQAIDEGSYTSTNWLMGNWTQQKADGTKGKSYLIKNGDKPGRISVYSIIEGETEAKPRAVTLSNVGGKIFISAWDESDDAADAGYYIYQMVKKSSTSFELLPVKERSISYDATSEEIRSFLNEHLSGDIYELKDVEFYKKG